MLALATLGTATGAAAAEPHFAIAILGVETEDAELKATAKQFSELIAAQLSSQPQMILVEREKLEAALSELELSLSGTVQPATAASIGQLVGARALVAGRLFFLGDELTATARVIGTETGRVFVETATIAPGEPVSTLASAIAEQLVARLSERRAELVGPQPEPDTRIERLSKLTEGKQLPTLSIAIEERHAGRPTIDPAAATELGMILKQLGFRLVESGHPHARADVQIKGEALSEEGLRKGNLVSASGRVEIQAIDAKSHEVITVDRRTELAVDLSGRIAGKKALQKASAELSEGLVLALLGR
jgi:hypothetical protein